MVKKVYHKITLSLQTNIKTLDSSLFDYRNHNYKYGSFEMEELRLCLEHRNTFFISDNFKQIEDKVVSEVRLKPMFLATHFGAEKMPMQEIKILNKGDDILVRVFIEDSVMAKKVYEYWKGLLGREGKINKAFEAMEKYINTPYEYGGGDRTSETTEGTKVMDCSEFVGRYLKEVGVHDKVLGLPTSGLANNLFNNINIIPHTDKTYQPKQGDIFIWTKEDGNTSGHTGIVKNYDSRTKKLVIIDASIDTHQVTERTMSLEHIIDDHKGKFYSPKN